MVAGKLYSVKGSPMTPQEYADELDKHLSHLVGIARQVNELDLASSLFEEFRGMQDAGWSTAITAREVFDEMVELAGLERELSKPEYRRLLCLYAQLAEAGGVYEGLKNIIGVVELKPYSLWPFQRLVRVRQGPKRIIGPNANAMFRDLATSARSIGMNRLSELLELTFRDDVRNGVAHADYIIWEDGLRLRKRNGGYANVLPHPEVADAIGRGLAFFQLLKAHNDEIASSFNPGRELVGRLSANPPMRWRVEFDAKTGSLSISGSSPGSETTPEYERQQKINNRLGGKVLSLYSSEWSIEAQGLSDYVLQQGFEPQSIILPNRDFEALIREVEDHALWDGREDRRCPSKLLAASAWGFRWLTSPADFEATFQYLPASEDITGGNAKSLDLSAPPQEADTSESHPQEGGCRAT